MISRLAGLLLSSQVTSEMEVQNIAQLIAAVCVFLCGMSICTVKPDIPVYNPPKVIP